MLGVEESLEIWVMFNRTDCFCSVSRWASKILIFFRVLAAFCPRPVKQDC